MIWVHLDESGIHDRATGKLRRLALAGCLAHEVDWLRFEMEWKPVLKAYNVDCFHMVDFEHGWGAFAGWDKPKRQNFLNQLLACFDPHVKAMFGASTTIQDPNEPLRVAYLNNIKRAMRNAFHVGHFWAYPQEKMSLVFAKHPQVASIHVEQYVEAVQEDIPNLGTVTFADPKEIVALQAADLVAYEIARFIPHQDLHKMRYPMARLWSTTNMSVGPEEPEQ